MRDKLIDFFGRKNIDREFIDYFAKYISMYAKDFGLDSNNRLALFLGQVKAEMSIRSDGSVRMRENLNYSVGSLMRIFSVYRQNPILAQKHGRSATHRADQVAIANTAYMNRNGNTKIDDGYRYRGAGIIQVTGKGNIEQCLQEVQRVAGIQIHTRDDVADDLLSSYTIGILISMAYWSINRLYLLTNSRDVTNRVNRGLDNRSKKLRDYYTQRAVRILEVKGF